MKKIVTDVMAVQIEKISGELKVIKLEISFIKEQTTKTNGTVKKHDSEIRTLQMSDSLHTLNCPYAKPVEEFMTIRKNWKVFVISGLTVAVLTVAGVFVTYANLRDLYFKDKIIIEQVQQVKKETKENKTDILNSNIQRDQDKSEYYRNESKRDSKKINETN